MKKALHVNGLLLPALLTELLHVGRWRHPGDDVLRDLMPWFESPLDFLTNIDPADPRVVVSDFWTDPKQCSWRAVAPTFSQLVEILRLV
ncbi:hypothetical protein ACIBJE_05470 [Micromonospora sp. NPDC050187]|uniref:hypothetical protein n=1 Tax=Micromonospora sp. NPDC050187 TaxID=3364277 RepID=UPI003795FC9A